MGTTTFRPQDQCTCPNLPCPRHSPGEQLGLYPKYRVEKLSGKPVGECFVLEADDPHAVAALRAYAESCHGKFGPLAADLLDMADRWQSQQS